MWFHCHVCHLCHAIKLYNCNAKLRHAVVAAGGSLATLILVPLYFYASTEVTVITAVRLCLHDRRVSVAFVARLAITNVPFVRICLQPTARIFSTPPFVADGVTYDNAHFSRPCVFAGSQYIMKKRRRGFVVLG